MRRGRLAAAGLSFLAAVVLTAVSNFAPAQAMPMAALKGASDNLGTTETVHCWDCGYRPYRSYYRPYYRPRPYWGGGYGGGYYRPYRPYWGGGYGGYYRPRPYYSGYYGGGYGGGYYRGYGGYGGGYYAPRRYYYVGPSVYWY